jgi:hypothetical protein
VTDDGGAELSALEPELRDAAALFDPVPEHLTRQAEELFAWRSIDDELAELVFDSAREAAAVVRGEDQPRLLTFHTDELSIELEVSTVDREHLLTGRLVPAQPAEVEVQRGGRRLAVATDQFGRFTVTPPDTGPLRLRCRTASDPTARAVVTDWFLP